MDEQRTTQKDAEQSEEKLEDAEQRDRLQDLDVTEEAGQSIKGGVPKQPDNSGEQY